MLKYLSVTLLVSGCTAAPGQLSKTVRNDTTEVDQVVEQLEYPVSPVSYEVASSQEPITAWTLEKAEVAYVDLTLEEILRMAMEKSEVLRNIGGVVLQAPDTVKTGFSTALQETDPRFGMEAALSAFDAQLNASASFAKNDQLYNNSFFAGGTNSFQQDLDLYDIELTKRTATGSQLSLRGVTKYDSNNAPVNTFPSYFNSWLEGEIRQPLLQGGGLEFNRIAGPGSTPGVYNGVLIAKANSDINYAEFTVALRDFVSNVENAYWDLYLAYRELDARKKAMEKALVLWTEVKARANAGSVEAAEEALARQQYYKFKSEVDEALSGRITQGTQTQNGARGGTLQPGSGVLGSERRLRLLVGLPAADGQLLRPSSEPLMAEVRFDWTTAIDEAMTQRPDLQRQHITVKKLEMELLAAKNFLNPQLDAFGRYRFRGYGHNLISDGNQNGIAPASSFGNLARGKQQEWEVGLELSVPLGYRKGHAAVQNAELALARARVIQREQQREVSSNLNGAIADVSRAYMSVQNDLNQYLAAKDYLDALETRKRNKQKDGPDRISDAQQRLLQAEIQFFRSRAEYAIALKNVHFEKGSLLRMKDLRIDGAPEVFVDYDSPEITEDPTLEPELVPVPPAVEEQSADGIELLAFNEEADRAVENVSKAAPPFPVQFSEEEEIKHVEETESVDASGKKAVWPKIFSYGQSATKTDDN